MGTYKKLPILVDFIKNWVHFIKNSDVISLVIDQSQPGVFYLKKMMNFMKPGVFYLQKIVNFMKPGVFYLQKMMNFMKPGVFYLQKMMSFMKMRTFYNKLPLFIKKTQFCILTKNSNLKYELYKKLHFWN